MPGIFCTLNVGLFWCRYSISCASTSRPLTSWKWTVCPAISTLKLNFGVAHPAASAMYLTSRRFQLRAVLGHRLAFASAPPRCRHAARGLYDEPRGTAWLFTNADRKQDESRPVAGDLGTCPNSSLHCRFPVLVETSRLIN